MRYVLMHHNDLPKTTNWQAQDNLSNASQLIPFDEGSDIPAREGQYCIILKVKQDIMERVLFPTSRTEKVNSDYGLD